MTNPQIPQTLEPDSFLGQMGGAAPVPVPALPTPAPRPVAPAAFAPLRPPLPSQPPFPVNSRVPVMPSRAAEPILPAKAVPSMPALRPLGITPGLSIDEMVQQAAMSAQMEREATRETREVRKDMATMKTLTRLLEAVFSRPGSTAPEEERMTALSTLASKSYELGSVVARVAGDDASRSEYIRAMSMDAAVTLVCMSWERGMDVNWDKFIEMASSMPEVDRAAQELAKAAYRPVDSVSSAADRITISMHSAIWRVYELGEKINGITPAVAAHIVRDCTDYLQSRNKLIQNNDLHVTWLQGSIRRIIDLACAELVARFEGQEIGPSPKDIEEILSISRTGFEGVENYAQGILEKPGTNPVSRPVDC